MPYCLNSNLSALLIAYILVRVLVLIVSEFVTLRCTVTVVRMVENLQPIAPKNSKAQVDSAL